LSSLSLINLACCPARRRLQVVLADLLLVPEILPKCLQDRLKKKHGKVWSIGAAVLILGLILIGSEN
jgi:hypothetical protein